MTKYYNQLDLKNSHDQTISKIGELNSSLNLFSKLEFGLDNAMLVTELVRHEYNANGGIPEDFGL